MSASDGVSEVDEGEDIWEEDWGEYDDLQYISLFTPMKFLSVDECCDHDAKEHGFDIRLYRREVTLPSQIL
jgi:hypothetical protein